MEYIWIDVHKYSFQETIPKEDACLLKRIRQRNNRADIMELIDSALAAETYFGCVSFEPGA